VAEVVRHRSHHSGDVARARPIDLLDRVLDKGIVIDAWARIALVGIDLISVEARVVVAALDSYVRHAALENR
jgi:hypothetical protein